MNEELLKKIAYIQENVMATDEKIVEDLVEQGYKKEDIQEILKKELWKDARNQNGIWAAREQYAGEEYPIWLNIWVWWVLLTLAYVPSSLIKLVQNSLIVRVMGLFVPFGLYNTMWSFIEFWGLPIIIFLVLQYQVHKFSKLLYFKYKNIWMIVFLNLFFLVLITAIVDIVIWGGWISMRAVFDPVKVASDLSW